MGPPGKGTAGNREGARSMEGHFSSFYLPFRQGLGEEMMHAEGGKSGGVAGKDHKYRFFREKFSTKLKQRDDVPFDFKHFSLASSAKGGGIENDPFVAGIPFDLPL